MDTDVAGGAVLTVDEVSVLIALLRHAAGGLPPALGAIADEYASRILGRVRDQATESAHEIYRARSAALSETTTALQHRVAAAQKRAARLREEADRWQVEARALRTEAEVLRHDARSARAVLADVQTLIGLTGPVTLDEDDALLVAVRDELRSTAA